jgi:hypothetical protein
MTPLEAGRDLALALLTVPGLRVSIGLGPAVVPPAVIVGAPTLVWEGSCGGPTSGSWPLYLVASLTEFSVDRLLSLIGPCVEAIEQETSAVVRNATPGIYPAGQQGDLPCYLIETEMGLSG